MRTKDKTGEKDVRELYSTAQGGASTSDVHYQGRKKINRATVQDKEIRDRKKKRNNHMLEHRYPPGIPSAI